MFFIKPQVTSRLWRIRRVSPGPMNLFVRILALAFKWSKGQFRWKPKPPTSVWCLAQHCQNTRCYCFAVGLLLFRRRNFLHLWCIVPSGDLLFRQKKKAKLIQEVSWKSLALVRFYLWSSGELTFFTLFAVCAFKGTRAVLSEANYGTVYFLRNLLLFRWYFLLNHNLYLVCGCLCRVSPGPMNLFVRISALAFRWSKGQFRWNPKPPTSMWRLAQYGQNTRCYCFAMGLLLFRRGFITVSPQEFPALMIFASSGDLLFCQKKKAKLI